MDEYRDIEKEENTKECQDFSMTQGEFFPLREYEIHHRESNRETKMNEEVYPDVMTSINAKIGIFKDRELWASKMF